MFYPDIVDAWKAGSVKIGLPAVGHGDKMTVEAPGLLGLKAKFLTPSEKVRLALEAKDACSHFSPSHNKTATISELITEAYSKDSDKIEVRSFHRLIRFGRKFGFPTVCTLSEMSEDKQMHAAACMLIEIAGTWPKEDIPDRLDLQPGSALYEEAAALLSISLGVMREIES
jgi:hypothetical protein|tara:strand:+ start:3055 stop:3567 length:513 start_codon:yes stop_codon:yes gene_type:complete